MSGRLLIPLLMAVSLIVGVAGIVWMRTQAPVVADVIDEYRAAQGLLRVRRVADSSNHMLEFRDTTDHVRWQALIPTYAGRPGASGLAMSDTAATVRVVRSGHAELWSFRMRSVPGGAAGSKLGALDLTQARPASPTSYTVAPVTFAQGAATDGYLTYEVLGDDTFTEVVVMDLTQGMLRSRIEAKGKLLRLRVEPGSPAHLWIDTASESVDAGPFWGELR